MRSKDSDSNARKGRLQVMNVQLVDSNRVDHKVPSYHDQKAVTIAKFQRGLPRHILFQESGELARNIATPGII